MSTPIEMPPTSSPQEFLIWALGIALGTVVILFLKRESDNKTHTAELKLDKELLQGQVEGKDQQLAQLQEQLRIEVKTSAQSLTDALRALKSMRPAPLGRERADSLVADEDYEDRTDAALVITAQRRAEINELVDEYVKEQKRLERAKPFRSKQPSIRKGEPNK